MLVKEKQTKVFDALKDKFGLTNVMQTPKITKVVVSVGTGKIQDKNKIEIVKDRLAKITGQVPSPRPAKKSIATFKVRAGDTVGYQVTLRGERMNSFLDKLIDVALPRTRDFRGLKRSSIDEMGNYTFGIKEHSVFPEASNEDVRDVFSMAVTIVTNTNDPEQTLALLEHHNFPLVKEEK